MSTHIASMFLLVLELTRPLINQSYWLERKIAQTAAGSTEKDRSDDRPLDSYFNLILYKCFHTYKIIDRMIPCTNNVIEKKYL